MNKTELHCTEPVAPPTGKQIRFTIWIGDNEFITEWVAYRVVDFTNRVTALVEAGHVFTVENRNA